ncbi:MAG: type I methionyl aminopeptidase [Omnitrophica WOR_2 bacterium RIFCSPLOWO2_12_FULL_51_8]|nr:MAG: type I methionyl aminopeptidase [Omnitrophica WOR_2 bacterium RIFCSPLOWO2_12_FULL_51_8]
MIPIKSERDLQGLRVSGKLLAKIMRSLQLFIRPGVSTGQINVLAEELILKEKALPAFKGYNGFPAAICTSVNEEIVHGIPGDRALEDGDIIGVDLGINYGGYFADAAFTLALGKIKPEVQRLIEVTRQALEEGIREARPENKLYTISHNIQSHVEKNGFSVVRQFVGHGIGFKLHEEPEIPNFGESNSGPAIKTGMVFAIEPMVNMGTWESRILDNGWTAVTKDGFPSAHFEHTVAVTGQGPEILTL